MPRKSTTPWQPEKHMGDTLSGRVTAQLLVRNGSGKAVRYRLAEAVEASSRP
jgi:hypothetical protein